MPLQTYFYTEENRGVWDKFVWQANNGTLFHTRQFLSYHPPDRFNDHSLLFYDDKRLVAILPAAIRVVDDEQVLTSHCGASFGGFVFKENLSVRMAFDLVESLKLHAKRERMGRIEMTFPPVVYCQRPTQYMDFALYKNGFTYKKREVSSIIPLDFTVEKIFEQFKPEGRTAARRSKKLGVTIRETEDLDAFYTILKKNLSLRHQVKPTHTLEELKKLHKIFPDRVIQFGAYLENQMIAGVTNFICNDRVMLAFYISHDDDFQKYRPVNSLFYEIIHWAILNHFQYLDFGIFTVNEDPNWSLGKFKESFGARGILRETFQINL